jgi:Protein of unknown function (DUF992)
MAYNKTHGLGWLVVAGSCCAWAAAGGAAQKAIVLPGDPMQEVGTLVCSLTGETEANPNTASSGIGRDVLCQFQPGAQGPEETYVGSVQGVGQAKLLFGRGAVLLSVKAPASTGMTPGLLSQSYSVDAAASGNAISPLVGENIRTITLQPLAEEEGRVGKGKTQPDAVLITVELKLQSSAG